MLKVWSESDRLAGLNAEQEATRGTAEKGLRYEENANHVANYVPKESYCMSPNTWSSSKETAEVMHRRYQKDAEQTTVPRSVGTMMSRVCMPARLRSRSGQAASSSG